jgi:hypothetical protein
VGGASGYRHHGLRGSHECFRSSDVLSVQLFHPVRESVNLPNKAAAMRLQVEADTYGIEFNDEYLRHNRDGSVTVTVYGDQQGLDRLDAAGYELARTISGPKTLEHRAEQREAGVRKEERADAAALDEPITITSHEEEIVILRADNFENYTGRYLSVEAKTRLAAVDPATGAYTCPTLQLPAAGRRGGTARVRRRGADDGSGAGNVQLMARATVSRSSPIRARRTRSRDSATAVASRWLPEG